MSIQQKLNEHNNDYSRLEPFVDTEPIPSSIIIPVYNHPELLARTLQNLMLHPEIIQNRDSFEVIVVNDG